MYVFVIACECPGTKGGTQTGSGLVKNRAPTISTDDAANCTWWEAYRRLPACSVHPAVVAVYQRPCHALGNVLHVIVALYGKPGSVACGTRVGVDGHAAVVFR